MLLPDCCAWARWGCASSRERVQGRRRASHGSPPCTPNYWILTTLGCGLPAGAAARAAEGAPVEELRDRALRALRALHGEDAVPAPVACTVSRWASEEWARGSYSYVAIGASARDYDQLATPVRG